MRGVSYLSLLRISWSYQAHHRSGHFSGKKNCMCILRLRAANLCRKNIDKGRVRKWKTEHSEKKQARKGKSRRDPDDNW